MMNYGITNLTNPYLWSSFGPYAWTSNFGYEMQMNIFPSNMPYYMAELGHGVLNPNHVSQWNPLFSIPTQDLTTNPALSQQGLNAAYEYGRNLMAQLQDNTKFGQAAQSLSAIKGQTEALIKDENLNDEQKQKLKDVQEKAKALQKELDEYKKAMQQEGADKTALREKLNEIAESAKVLEKRFVELVKQIKEELENAEEAEEDEKQEAVEDAGAAQDAAGAKKPEGGSEGTVGQTAGAKNNGQAAGKQNSGEGTQNTGTAQGAAGAKKPEGGSEGTVGQTAGAKNNGQAEGKQNSGEGAQNTGAAEQASAAGQGQTGLTTQSVNGNTEFSPKYSQSQYTTSAAAIQNGKDIAKDLYDSIDGWGTDEEKLDNAMKSITKDNVMEVLDAWNKTHGKEFGESLLESIYGDIYWNNERAEYTRMLMDALAEKAEEAGIDISDEYGQLNDELKSRFGRDEEKIYELINTIHKNLGGREYKKAA